MNYQLKPTNAAASIFPTRPPLSGTAARVSHNKFPHTLISAHNWSLSAPTDFTEEVTYEVVMVLWSQWKCCQENPNPAFIRMCVYVWSIQVHTSHTLVPASNYAVACVCSQFACTLSFECPDVPFCRAACCHYFYDCSDMCPYGHNFGDRLIISVSKGHSNAF